VEALAYCGRSFCFTLAFGRASS